MIAPARPDRIQVWASQLAANDFPPVCAVTGRPAETWRKFRFATPPQWAYALLVLVCAGGIGIILFGVVIALISQRATGYLPLTREGRRQVELAVWIPAGLLIAWVVLWAAAAVVGLSSNDPSAETAAGFAFWVGTLLLIAGLIGRFVVMRFLVIQARVMEPFPGQLDKPVELRNVHPNFVAAVNEQHYMRAAQASRPR